MLIDELLSIAKDSASRVQRRLFQFAETLPILCKNSSTHVIL